MIHQSESLLIGKNVVTNRYLCSKSRHVFLAITEHKMANISLDVHTVHSLLKLSQNIISILIRLHFPLIKCALYHLLIKQTVFVAFWRTHVIIQGLKEKL